MITTLGNPLFSPVPHLIQHYGRIVAVMTWTCYICNAFYPLEEVGGGGGWIGGNCVTNCLGSDEVLFWTVWPLFLVPKNIQMDKKYSVMGKTTGP